MQLNNVNAIRNPIIRSNKTHYLLREPNIILHHESPLFMGRQ